MNKRQKLFMAATIVLLIGTVGIVWAGFTPSATYNRPNPLMDYVPQELGIYDGWYSSLAEDDCRLCHGNSLADRHHYSELALVDGLCTPCHEVLTVPPYIEVTNDCSALGCHDTYDNGWHHLTDLSATDQCIACHEPGLLDRVTDINDLTYPQAGIVSPSPFSCENCHWEQPIVDDTLTAGSWSNGDPQTDNPFAVSEMDKAGHPSSFDHNNPYGGYSQSGATAGNWNDYFEYRKKIESNYDTHHMESWLGNVGADCYRCHAMDEGQPAYYLPNTELIRYCRTCHDIPSLHAIEPHVGTGGTGDPPAVRGWEAAGFHVIDGGGNLITSPADVAPTVYGEFSANEQCLGCHADNLPTWLPDPPPAAPVISDMTPTIGACYGIVTLTGNNFGNEKTSDRNVLFRPTSGGTWDPMPCVSWTDQQIEFMIPCRVYGVGNHYVIVDTESGPPSSPYEVFILDSQGSLDSVSPTTGPCRQPITIHGSSLGPQQDVIPSLILGDGPGGAKDFGLYTVVVFSSTGADLVGTQYSGPGAWTETSFDVMFGDVFEDLDGDYLWDSLTEQRLRQCENLPLGTYSVYVKTLYYEDVNENDKYDDGDIIHQLFTSDPEYFTMEDQLALYALFPSSIERSHYCGSNVTNSIVKIYGWGFGPAQGTGKVYIGTGGMYLSDTGLELPRVLWSSLLIKAAVDVPEGAEGMNLYIWVEKGGMKTDASYGYPVIHILDVDPQTCP